MIRIKKILLKIIVIFIFLCTLSIHTTDVYAASSIEEIEEFKDMETVGKYAADEYRDNYYLDIEATGLLESGDKILNQVANTLFSFISTLAYLIIAFFYYAMGFDMADMFASEIDTIQSALKSSIFDTLFILAFSASAWALMKRISKRDLTGLIVEVGKVFVIIIFSALVVTHSATALSGATSITKEISVAALLDINGQDSDNVTSYAAETSGMLWQSLVHDPWLALEFGKVIPKDDEIIELFLKTSPGSEERETLVESFIEENKGDDPSVMSKGLGVKRIGFLLVYIIPFFIKSGIYAFMAVLMLAFQVMAVFFVLLAPVILLLALIPACGGIDLVTVWLKKILETQIMVLVITFLMGIIIKLDNLLYGLADEKGWLIVIFMETLIALIIVVNYKSILKGIGSVSRSARRPQAIKHQLQNSGNIITPGSMNMHNYKMRRKAPINQSYRSLEKKPAEQPNTANKTYEADKNTSSHQKHSQEHSQENTDKRNSNFTEKQQRTNTKNERQSNNNQYSRKNYNSSHSEVKRPVTQPKEKNFSQDNKTVNARKADQEVKRPVAQAEEKKFNQDNKTVNARKADQEVKRPVAQAEEKIISQENKMVNARKADQEVKRPVAQAEEKIISQENKTVNARKADQEVKRPVAQAEEKIISQENKTVNARKADQEVKRPVAQAEEKIISQENKTVNARKADQEVKRPVAQAEEKIISQENKTVNARKADQEVKRPVAQAEEKIIIQGNKTVKQNSSVSSAEVKRPETQIEEKIVLHNNKAMAQKSSDTTQEIKRPTAQS